MEVLLPKNIKMGRKRLGLTQEQLAEAMGVSVGTVSKWENGNSLPDIEMIIELADFFQESVDVLLGYEWKHKSVGQTVEYLRKLKNEHRYEEGAAEAKKALKKFPNHAEVLYECGEILYMSVLMRKNDFTDERRGEAAKSLTQVIDIFQKVEQMLAQKDNPAVSRVKIHQEIGIVYGILGQEEKAISYLEKHNVSDQNDWMISNFLINLKQYDKAWDTVTRVFQRRVFEMFQCYWVMFSVLINTGKYDELLGLATWMEGFCLSVQDGKSSYYIRAAAATEAMIATAYAYKSAAGHKDYTPDIGLFLRRAVKNAGEFDNAPDYSGRTRFTDNLSESVYDGHSQSAIHMVKEVLRYSEENKEAFSVLRRIFDRTVQEIGHDEWSFLKEGQLPRLR